MVHTVAVEDPDPALTDTVSAPVSPSPSRSEVGDTVTSGEVRTLICAVARFVVSASEIAVMVVEPSARPDTTPDEDTDATDGVLLR